MEATQARDDKVRSHGCVPHCCESLGEVVASESCSGGVVQVMESLGEDLAKQRMHIATDLDRLTRHINECFRSFELRFGELSSLKREGDLRGGETGHFKDRALSRVGRVDAPVGDVPTPTPAVSNEDCAVTTSALSSSRLSPIPSPLLADSAWDEIVALFRQELKYHGDDMVKQLSPMKAADLRIRGQNQGCFVPEGHPVLEQANDPLAPCHRSSTNTKLSDDGDMNAWTLLGRKTTLEVFEQIVSKDAAYLSRFVPACAKTVYKRMTAFLASKEMPDTYLARFVTGLPFFWFYIIVIFANSFFLAYDAHENVRAGRTTSTDVVEIATKVFLALFAIEIVFKAVGEQWMYVCGDDRWWNFLDVFLLAISLPELWEAQMNVTFARILKMVRIARVSRIFRVIKIFDELRQMAVSIAKTLMTLFWSSAVFLFTMYVFAIGLMQGMAAYIEDATTPEEHEIIDNAMLLYGSFNKTMLTLFYILSGGDWLSASGPLTGIIPGVEYLIAFYVFFMTFGILNVLIGMFCEKAVDAVSTDRTLRTSRERDETESFVAEMKTIFGEMDVDGTGEIEWPEFRKYITEEETGHYLRSHGIVTNDARQLFQLLDEMDDNPSGSMDLASFVIGMQRLSGNAKGTDLVIMNMECRKRERVMLDGMANIQRQLDWMLAAPIRSEGTAEDSHVVI